MTGSAAYVPRLAHITLRASEIPEFVALHNAHEGLWITLSSVGRRRCCDEA